MESKALIRRQEGGSVLLIDVTPNASRTEMTGINQWREALQVRVAAVARDGAANRELADFLSGRLGVPRAQVRILKGHRSSVKSVFVPLPPEETLRRLGVA